MILKQQLTEDRVDLDLNSIKKAWHKHGPAESMLKITVNRNTWEQKPKEKLFTVTIQRQQPFQPKTSESQTRRLNYFINNRVFQ